MAIAPVKKTAQVHALEIVHLPNEVFKIVYLNLTKLNDIRSLLLTNWKFNLCISADNLLWGDFVKSRFPYSYQKYENGDNFKDVFKSLKVGNDNIEDYKFRTCSWQGHTKKVTCMISQKDKFVSGASDGTVILWNRHTRKMLYEWDLSAHGACTGVAMEGDTVFAGSKDGALSTLNATNGEKIHEAAGDGKTVHSLQLQADKLIYASGSYAVKIWDRTKKELIKTFHAMTNSIVVQKNRLLLGGVKIMQVYDQEGDPVQGWQAHDYIITGLTVQGDRFFSVTSDGDVKCWRTDGNMKKIVRQINLPDPRKEISLQDNAVYNNSGSGIGLTCKNGKLLMSTRSPEDPIGLIAQEDKVFCALDDIAVLDFKSGKVLYQLKDKQPVASACMQDGMLISGSNDGTLTIRDFNFPSLTAYDGFALEKNLVLLGQIADKDDPLCKELHPKFADRLRELADKPLPFNEVSLRLKIEVSLHLLLDRIHRGDQKRITEILALPIWNEMSSIDGETTKLYTNIKTICLDLKELKTKEAALEFLKQKEQVVLKFIKHLKK